MATTSDSEVITRASKR